MEMWIKGSLIKEVIMVHVGIKKQVGVLTKIQQATKEVNGN